ncbi:right-handed parallel beta-helix repeat-containing protein [Candidatus Woesearchaeota archaeon]|nr:right-handed parallel beta-helix repeat-containing protein [Candidatus Woesearchaeota archaeon]
MLREVLADMGRGRLFVFLVFVLVTVSFVAAHDRLQGHDGCQLNGCPLGHGFDECSDGSGDICGPDNIRNSGDECPWTDMECGAAPKNGCDVRVSTAFAPGSYTLPFGIDICAPSITLNCNGATLIGSSSSDGIYEYQQDSVTITNCNVRNYQNGISLSYSNNNNLINNNANSNNAHGIVTSSSSGNTFSGNVVLGNGIIGISLQQDSNFNILQNNIASNNPAGIQLWHSSNENILVNNIIYGNNEGVYFDSSISNTINANVFCPSNNNVDFIAYNGDIADNSGSDNSCDKPGAWGDHGTVGLEIRRYPGCTFTCAGNDMGDFHLLPSAPWDINTRKLQWRVTENGVPKANELVKIELLPYLNYDGGHVVETHTPQSRPLGKLSGDLDEDGIIIEPTDSNGVISVDYEAPEPAGAVEIKASIVAAPEKSASYIAGVYVPDLLPLPFDRDNLKPYGSRGEIEPEHPERWHATVYTKNKLLDAGNRYRQYQQSDPLLRTITPEPIFVNDMSLPWGGLFDIVDPLADPPQPVPDWTPPHICHRYGGESDIRVTHLMKSCGGSEANGTTEEKPIKKRQYELLEQALNVSMPKKKHCEGDHLHVQWEWCRIPPLLRPPNYKDDNPIKYSPVSINADPVLIG